MVSPRSLDAKLTRQPDLNQHCAQVARAGRFFLSLDLAAGLAPFLDLGVFGFSDPGRKPLAPAAAGYGRRTTHPVTAVSSNSIIMMLFMKSYASCFVMAGQIVLAASAVNAGS